jgi:hypothetical protein
MFKARLYSIVFAAAACAIPALAVDGVTLINQSTVLATGGFPYKIAQSGSYRLAGNLVAPSGQQAILIAANNVVLDLNGFGVACTFGAAVVPTFCVGDGGLGSGVTDVSIRNGVVAMTQTSGATGFFAELNTAAGFHSSSNLIIEGLHIVTTNLGTGAAPLGLDFGANSIIRHNIISANGFSSGSIEGCPSLVEGNVNTSAILSSSGSGCVKVNNVGSF